MATHSVHDTKVPQEKAIVVGIDRGSKLWSLQDSLEELKSLTETAGAVVVAQTSQKLIKPNSRTFVGSGKAEEIASLCRTYAADVVIFDDELTPSQQSNLEKIVPKTVKIIDRTALILDIFALHATTKEGRLQVRLAQSQYLLPRLRGMWAHLASNRMGGGVGSRFGEGESQLEVDRRMVRDRITSIKRELKQVDSTRKLQRESRYSSGMYKVAFAGYTNAGKSSLLNALTDANVLSYDKLFATLDSTTRKYTLPEGREITLTDTVGFIQKLPHNLVNAFKPTLNELLGCDLILHVIDASSQDCEAQIESVNQVLEEIGASEITSFKVYNKIDRLDAEELDALKSKHPDAIFISAAREIGFEELLEKITHLASSIDEHLHVTIPFNRGDLVSLAHSRATIISEEFAENGTVLEMLAPASVAGRFHEFVQ